MPNADGQELRPVRAVLPLDTFERLMWFARTAGGTVDEAAAYAIAIGIQVIEGAIEGAREEPPRR